MALNFQVSFNWSGIIKLVNNDGEELVLVSKISHHSGRYHGNVYYSTGMLAVLRMLSEIGPLTVRKGTMKKSTKM